MIAALADAYRHRTDSDYSRALGLTLRFVRQYQADPKDGVWYDTVTFDGAPKNVAKAHNWKANYHDVRALVKLIETFAPGR
jgi:mannose/cellobiose epimerase-like protein (N-acyl-D-glucosamine 2-epimerase family)